MFRRSLFLRARGTRFAGDARDVAKNPGFGRLLVMGGLSLPHLLLLGVVVLILFGGKGKISEIMGDVAKGIKSFKKGLSDEETPAKQPVETARTIEHQAQSPIDASRDVNKAS
jgi:sec-independent protein translocase protein TatA